MKTINYVIDDFSVGKKCFLEELSFEEKENYFFLKQASFYRRYTLEMGLDVCILKLEMDEDLILRQLKSLNALYYTQVLEITDGDERTMKISHNDGLESTELELARVKNMRCIWFSFSSRWLENKALVEDTETGKFAIPKIDLCLPKNPYFVSLFNEIFEVADKSPVDNFKLKLKLYVFLDQLILAF
jgi:hypothetical protein